MPKMLELGNSMTTISLAGVLSASRRLQRRKVYEK
jgi:hypothetical protein